MFIFRSETIKHSLDSDQSRQNVINVQVVYRWKFIRQIYWSQRANSFLTRNLSLHKTFWWNLALKRLAKITPMTRLTLPPRHSYMIQIWRFFNKTLIWRNVSMICIGVSISVKMNPFWNCRICSCQWLKTLIKVFGHFQL